MPYARVMLVVGLAAIAAACAEEKAPLTAEAFADGRRLRAQYFELPGGTKVFRRFFDTAIDEPCLFDGRFGPSGADTCLPVSAAELTPRGDFADSACTVPAIFLGSEPLPALVVVMPANACEAEPTVFERGARLATHYERTSDGRCSETGTGIFYGLGAPVALDTFVSARAEPEVRTDRIGALTLMGEDGSRQVIAGWDAERQESVIEGLNISRAPDRWIPRGRSRSENRVFSDASCARPVARQFGPSALCPLTTILDVEPTFFNAVGARLDPLTLFARDAAGACAARDPIDGGDRYFDIGEPIAAEDFAELELVEHGSGRVRRRDAASPMGTAILPTNSSPLLLDTTTGQPCQILTAADGAARCLPPVFDGGYFADAECTQALLQTVEPPGAIVTIAEATPPTYVVRHVDAPYMGAAMYVAGLSGCTVITPVGGFSYHLLGETVAPAEFEAAIVRD